MNRTRLTAALAVLALSLTAAIAPASAGTSGPAAQDGKYRVSLKASTKQAVQKQDKVKLTGKVRPKAPGTKVRVQLQYDGRNAWKTIGSAKVRADGSYKFVDKPTSRLDRSYRVVKAGDRGATKGVSRERAVEVYGWDWLDTRLPSAGSNVRYMYRMPINGGDYGHTLYLDRLFQTGFTEYTLGRKCLALEATFGLSDRTETGGQGSIQLALDGVSAFKRTFNLGEDDAQQIDVTGVYRVRMDFSQQVGTPVTEPAAGGARVLCD